MGALMIRCPNTGYASPTGYEADPARFREMPVFFAVSYCPICRLDHQWFAADAWVREQAAERGSLRDKSTPARIGPGTQSEAATAVYENRGNADAG